MAKGKTQANKQPSSTPAAIATGMNLPEGFKAKRTITLPSLVLKEVGAAKTVKILDEMRVSKIESKPTADGKKREPATICTVVDVATGEQAIMLVPAVVKANLLRDYPDGKYVGLTFYVKNNGKRSESQRYNDFMIVEVEAA